MAKRSVAIVGCGVNGMFCAYFLLKKGFDVTIIDKNKDGLTSSNNAGLLTPSLSPAPSISAKDTIKSLTVGFGPVYISPSQVIRNMKWFLLALKKRNPEYDKVLLHMGERSLYLYKRFFKEEGVDADVKSGVAALYKSSDEAKVLSKRYKGRFIDQYRISGMGYTGLSGGIYFDDEISINPVKLYSGLRAKVGEMGAEIMLGKEAELVGNGQEIDHVFIGSKDIKADNYISATGSWSNNFLSNIGYNPQIIPARGLSMIFSTGNKEIISNPSLLEDYGMAVAQHSQNNMRATTFFELVGINGNFRKSRKEWMLSILRTHLDKFNYIKLEEEGYGFRPCTPDQMPVVGRVPNYKNLFIAGGQCRVGVTLAPMTGQIISDMISGSKHEVRGIDYLSPQRFAK